MEENKEQDLENFSDSEMKKFKRLSLVFMILLVLAIVSILVLIIVKYEDNKNSYYCLDTGLYRSIDSDNNVISYTEETLNNMDKIEKESKEEDLVTELAEDFSSVIRGNEFKTSVSINSKVRNYLSSYITDEEDYSINLTDLFGELIMEPFGSGEGLYTPYEIDNGVRKSRWYVTAEEYTMLDGKINGLNSIDEIEVDSEIIGQYGSNLIGYVEIEEELSELISADIFEDNGNYFVKLSDLELSDDNSTAYIDFFGEQSIDLKSMPSCRKLRLINPDNKFTWIVDRCEKSGDWYNVSMRNSLTSDEGIFSCKVKDKKVISVKLSGLE